MSTNKKFTKKQLDTIFKIAFLEAMALSLILPSVTSTGEPGITLPLSFTFIIKAPSLNTYQAFITGGSPTIPLFSESNITKLIHDDIEQGGFCNTGCSSTINPGVYNVTQTIVIDKSNVALAGQIASLFLPQNMVFSGGPCGATHRPVFCIQAASFTASGFKVDDIARDFVAGVTGMVFDNNFITTTPQLVFQSVTIWNASSIGIEFGGSSIFGVSFCTILGPTPLPKTAGNHGIAIGVGASAIRIAFNTISRFNGSDTAAINVVQGVTNVTIIGNDLFQNAVGIIIQKPLVVSITGNNIHNNFGPGFVLTTLNNVFRGNAISISANVITNNALNGRPDPLCNSTLCSGIVLRGSFAGYDTVGITDNVIKDTQAIRTQQFDIDIRSTQYTNLTIQGNTLGLSASGTTIDITVTPLPSWRIESNNGYNPQPVRGPLTAGATPFTYTNNDAYLEQIELITIGDMTNFVCRGVSQIILANSLTPNLNPGDTCIFTYTTTAPTYDILPT